jgi:hypothetical protein
LTEFPPLNLAMLFRALLLIGVGLAAMRVIAAESSPLANSPSAFVRAQADSGVRWHPWNDATLAEARKANKSVYVFIGSPLSELTRATINQTFGSAKTVEWLNANFFCIFVDADERPDVASYGQHFIRTVKQLQGMPVHLWLTPDLQVYDGANYLPPSEEWGKPGFLKAARSALESWTTDAARARALAEEAAGMMRGLPLTEDWPTSKVPAAMSAWIRAIDSVNGGFGSAPKQPEPEVIQFLLVLGAGPNGHAPHHVAALNAARALVKGAARDPVDGGFYRRCIDEAWKEPYYQKTLADQARIALALFRAAEVGKDASLRSAAVGALDFVLKELRNPDGSFIAALDGTLDETTEPGKRPKFTRVGTATTGALGLLIVALCRGEDRHREAAAGIMKQLNPSEEGTVAHHPGSIVTGTATDHLAVALAFRYGGNNTAAERVLARAGELYFDAQTGSYQSSPAQLPVGIGVRVPVYGETPSPEVLALLAGVDASTAALIRHALLVNIEYDEQPPGDVLWALIR